MYSRVGLNAKFGEDPADDDELYTNDNFIGQIPTSSTNGNVRIRRGRVTLEDFGFYDGETLNVYVIEDTRAAGVFVSYIEPPSGSANTDGIGFAQGPVYSNPPTGEVTYTGMQTLIGPNDRTFDPSNNIGTFTLNIDFGEETFSYNGETSGITVEGMGRILPADGTFGARSSPALRITDGDNIIQGGQIRGQLHGSGGTSTSGFFRSGVLGTAEYSGSFIGIKQE